MTTRNLLIVGAGSIGGRHGNNLSQLGCTISAVDPRAERRSDYAAAVPTKATYEDMAAALAADRFDGVVVCSPTSFHADHGVQAARAGVPILLEKPVAKNLADAERLAATVAEAGVPLLLGYTWRWWPPLSRMRELLEGGAIGKVRYAEFVLSAHLEDWHPGEPLSEFFMSSADLGGGALLDESHWIDLMVWLFGMPSSLVGTVETIGGMEISSDDNVDVLVAYDDGLRASLHLDIYGRPHRKSIRLIGDDGSILWTESPNRVAVCNQAEDVWSNEDFDCVRNDAFVAVDTEFLQVLEGEPAATCTLDEGLDVMRIIEAVRSSQADGRRISL